MNVQTMLEGGEALLEQMIIDRTQESLTLDFKRGSIFKEGLLDSPNRATLGAALSAFANAVGGILVIGVDARKTKDGIDCAGELMPVASFERAQTTLAQAVGDLLQSRHSGIRVYGIPSSRRPGYGYLVVDVPASSQRPHRSQADAKYYKRAGASNFVMEHYEVVDAIRSSAAPDLALGYELTKGISRPHEKHFEARLRLALTNLGRATARHVSLQITNVGPYGVGWHGLGENVMVNQYNDTRTISHIPELVIHPGETRYVCSLTLDVINSASAGTSIGGVPDQRSPLKIAYRSNAEHFGSEAAVLEVTLHEIYSAAACY
ncbi:MULTISPECIES: AlbA family DNA-binding domain-containing protein [Sinorhizobium]|uniref:Schlafen AlbA-2 domain-containing protein n=1 Tax=Sinorhizobium americanum TaxID=194963 RepID=A0A2S3YVH7_9HYPH|nr:MULTISPECIES: ATP-binding protein [Sinorhizobium]PDT39712.1 hypothetical protein CO656_21160 [Sinorhizobium sp. FG01]POH35636.1 hypothetical protein ATY31_02190 [Sinorhizobium americanum]